MFIFFNTTKDLNINPPFFKVGGVILNYVGHFKMYTYIKYIHIRATLTTNLINI